MVRHDKQAIVHSARFFHRSGLDDFVLSNGRFFVSGLVKELETEGFQPRPESEILESI